MERSLEADLIQKMPDFGCSYKKVFVFAIAFFQVLKPFVTKPETLRQ